MHLNKETQCCQSVSEEDTPTEMAARFEADGLKKCSRLPLKGTCHQLVKSMHLTDRPVF